jgi:HEAT repeat protein
VLTELCRPGTEKPLRLAALISLARFGPAAKSALPVLIEAVKSDEPDVRQAAGQVLGSLGAGAGPAVPALTAALADPDPTARKVIVSALGKVGPPAKDAVPALVQLLGADKDRDLRLRIVVTLGEIGKAAKGAVPQMIGAFADEKLNTELSEIMQTKRDAATCAAALKSTLNKVDNEFQARNVAALTKIGKLAVPFLVKGLADNNAFVRWGSIKVLANLGPEAKAAAGQLSVNARLELLPELRTEANAALQKLLMKR